MLVAHRKAADLMWEQQIEEDILAAGSSDMPAMSEKAPSVKTECVSQNARKW
jgi:hypothetical protein